MSQFLRPNSNITQTRFTGGYADIDESSPSDADKAYANATNQTCVLEVGLTDPTTPGAGATTVRYRYAKSTLGGVITSAGTNPTFMVSLYQGATLIASQSAPTAAALRTQEWTPDVSAVSDWSDLRLRFTVGTTTAGVQITWAEIEAPDAQPGYMDATEAKDVFASSGTVSDGTLAATEAKDVFASTGTLPVAGSMAGTEAPDVFFAEFLRNHTPIDGVPYVCERCGFEYPLTQLRKEWTGLWVCRRDYDPKPAELTPPRVTPEGVPKVPSRYPEDNDTPNLTTRDEL